MVENEATNGVRTTPIERIAIMRTFLKPDTMSAATGKAWKFMNVHEKLFFATKVGLMVASFGWICANTIAPEKVQPSTNQDKL